MEQRAAVSGRRPESKTRANIAANCESNLGGILERAKVILALYKVIEALPNRLHHSIAPVRNHSDGLL
jgi:hypothetical protein